MDTHQVQQLTATFEGHAQQTENGVEYWLARDLQQLLGYAEWRNFNQTVISKAKTACEVSGHAVSDHFVDVNKMVSIGSDTKREVDDVMLHNARVHQMRSEPQISHEHVTNNAAVRDTLLNRGIRPESLAPSEDVKKIERRLTSDVKKTLKNPDTLGGT
ncbi:MAG: hypothetical protein H7343_16655 [Undibacterium sp.]|nr:hypothetical protein [Opitutaceae bacterium]